MAVNREKPHILILPEDDRARRIANGFQLHINGYNQVRIGPECGGWKSVRDVFRADHVRAMQQYPKRLVILFVDFDSEDDRYDRMMEAVPIDLRDRVFVLGPFLEMEDLTREGFGLPERIGQTLAEECLGGPKIVWNSQLLAHNAPELERLAPSLCSIL